MPKPTLAGGGRLAWSVCTGYLRLVCRVAGVVAGGLAANWGFLAFAVWQFGASPRVGSGIIVLIAFGVLFPAAYLLVGQRQGIQSFLRHCYRRHESSIVDFLLLFLQRVTVVTEGSRNPLSAANIRAALKRVDEMPWAIRLALRHYLRGQQLQALALEIMDDSDFRSGHIGLAKQRYSARIHECVLGTLLCVEARSLWTLASVNASVAALTWLSLR